jgi:hypothetical protein
MGHVTPASSHSRGLANVTHRQKLQNYVENFAFSRTKMSNNLPVALII